MKENLKTGIDLGDDLLYASSSQILTKMQLTKVSKERNLKIMTSEQRKKEARRPIYLVRYE